MIKLSLLLFSFLLFAQDDFEIIEDFEDISEIDFRDPFESPDFNDSSNKSKKNNYIKPDTKGVSSSKAQTVLENPDNIIGIALDRIKVNGIFYSNRSKTALVADKRKSKNFVKVKEGMKISGKDIHLKQITKNALIFVEQITNVYGKAEFVETVIPISK